jgi:hypothetical protein
MAASQRTFGAYRDLAAVSGIPYAGLAGGVADYAAAASLSTSGGGRWERMLLPPRALDRISIGTPVPILGGSVSLGLAYVKPAQGRTNRIANVSYGEEGDARERADSSGCATIRGGASMVAAATPMAASRTELSTAGSMPSTTARWRRSSQCRRGDLRLGEPRPHHPFRTSLRGQREREAPRGCSVKTFDLRVRTNRSNIATVRDVDANRREGRANLGKEQIEIDSAIASGESDLSDTQSVNNFPCRDGSGDFPAILPITLPGQA